MSTRRLVLSLLAVTALAAPAAPAFAQDPLVSAYGGSGPTTENEVSPPAPSSPTVENQITPPGQVEAEVVSSPKKATPVSETAPTAAAQPETAKGSLPFTGLDARLLALAGIALAGIGFATRRLAQRMD